MDDDPRAGRYFAGLLAGFLILAGGGCRSIPAIRAISVKEPVVSSTATALSPIVSEKSPLLPEYVCFLQESVSRQMWNEELKPALIPLFDDPTALNRGFERDLFQKFDEGWRLREICLQRVSTTRSIVFSLFYPTNPDHVVTSSIDVIKRFPKTDIVLPGSRGRIPKGYETDLSFYPTPNVLGSWSRGYDFRKDDADPVTFSKVIGVTKSAESGDNLLTNLTDSWDWKTGYYSIRARAEGSYNSRTGWGAAIQFLPNLNETGILKNCTSSLDPLFNHCLPPTAF